MKNKISKDMFGIVILITVLSALWLTGAGAAPAAYQPNPYQMKDSFSKSPKDASISLNAINGLTVDPFTGAANLSFPLSLPPGRGGMQPPLNLSYSTSYPNGPLGVGWRLELGYLERSTKDGIPSYGRSDKYIFSLNGFTSELVYANNAYYPKIAPENLKFTFDGSYWKAKDRQGKTYYFGDPTMPGSLEKRSAAETFRWYLVKIEDPQGNYVRIEYTAGTNYSMLAKIYYTLNPALGNSYSYIFVEFLYEAAERNDRFSHYRPGYYLTIPPGRLSSVKIWLQEPAKKTLVRKYAFEYKYSNLTNRSLLTKITEYGSDEKTTLPQVNFSYQENEPTYSLVALTDPSDMFADFNGDGFADMATFDQAGGSIKVRLYAQGNFPPPTEWIKGISNSDFLLGDFNGDGRVDICTYGGNVTMLSVLLSDGRRFIDKGLWQERAYYYAYYKPRPFVGDVNGDGLSDIIVNRDATPFEVSVSTGRSFEFYSSGKKLQSSYLGEFIADYEGDGMADICEYSLDNGAWLIQPLSNLSQAKTGLGSLIFGSDKYGMAVDANSDGLSDAVYYDYANGKVKRKILDGKRFKDIADAPFVFSLRNANTKMQASDFNGDGLMDYAVFYDGQIEIAYSQGNFSDILVKVENGIGASTEFYYKPSTAYTNRRSDGTPGLPFVIPVFYQDKIYDGQGNVYATTYDYLSGLYDAQEKEFAGFGFCRITTQEGNYTEKFFRQDKELRGKIYRETVKDKDRNIFASTESVWEKKELYPGVNLVYLKQRDDFTYDGDTAFRQRRTNFEYDNYGNCLRIVYAGDVSLAGDEKTQIFEYSYNTLENIVSLPSRAYIQDAVGNRVQEKRFHYDGDNSYTTPPLKGLLTREEAWFYNPITSSQSWLGISYKYDTFGNLIETTDPLGRTSKIEYDSALRTLPVKSINALGQAAITTYNYGTGNPLTVSDANNQTTTYQYDQLGRLIAVIGPLDSAQYPGITYVYSQIWRPTIVVAQKRIQPLSSETYVTHQFFDGLGRIIQTKAPVASNKSVISDIAKFDSQGRKKEAFLPYYVNTALGNYALPDYSQPKAIFEYDCMGRPVKTTNPDGTYSQSTHSGWTTTVIDENGHQSQRVLDAYGRTLKVLEYNDNQIYTTAYEYDTLGNLIRVTDDQGNQTVFTYDSLGRKLRVSDPDMGVWQYEYDAVGNLTRQTDAKGQALLFEYDALNRILFKRGLSSGGTITDTLSAYAYDNAAKGNCIGRLSKVTNPSGSSEYLYDKAGRKIKEIKTVDSVAYATEYTYDSLDRLLTLKYPDATLIKYEYSVQGTTKVANITNPSSPVNYLSASEFSAANQITKNTFGNNAVTNYTYNPKNLRLDSIVTQNTTRKLQDLQYNFDNAGNISRIKDNLNTTAQDFIYDGLNRLTQATGAYGVLTYNYDSLGNMLNKEGLGFVYGQGHVRPHALFYASDGSQFSYDDNGNLSEEYAPNRGKVKYSYNLENRLVKVEPKEQARQEFTFTLRLNPGWNLFSLPIIPKDSDILQVLKNLKPASDYDQVARYNAASKTWEMFTNQPEFDQFFTLEYGRGYQIYLTNPAGATLTVQGYLSSTESEFPVSQGWNLVCYPYAAVSSPVETALRSLSLGVDYDTVEQYNSTTGATEKYTASQKQFSELKQGRAYYVRALKDTKWKVPAQNSAALNLAGAVEQNDFVYDYSGERIKKITPKGATVYIGSIFEKLPNGTTRLHVFSGSSRIATITKGLPPAGSLPEVIYYHPDHLGSSNVVSDKNGNHAQLSEYTPFGAFSPGRLPPAGSRISHYFTGKELDTSGLYHYAARYYHPGIAHFTQPDPIIQNIYDPQALNHYAYCRNNPLIFTDPSGMSLTGPSWGGFGSSWNSFWGGIGSGWGSFWGGFSSAFSLGISTIGRWGMQTWGSTAGDSLWRQGFGSGLYNGIITTSAVIVGTALLAPLLPEVSIIAGAGYLLGGIGSVGLGLSTGMAITGKDLLGNNLSSFERGKLAGGSLPGWGMLGLGAWDQLRNTGKLFNINNNLVIGKMDDLNRAGALRLGESTLRWSDQGSPKLNWKMNSSLLRLEMQRGIPIRDISDSSRYNTNSFLGAERNLLRNHEWKFNQETSYWNPPDW